MYPVKADLDPKEMVALTLFISFFSLVSISALHVLVIGTVEVEPGLPKDLPYLNLNCFSNVSGSLNTYADAG